MKVGLRLKLEHLPKVPAKEMPLGPYLVESRAKVFDIKKEDKWLLESKQCMHWMDVYEVDKSAKVGEYLEEKLGDLDREEEQEIEELTPVAAQAEEQSAQL